MIVGAGQAGLQVAETLRHEKYTGPIIMFGAEAQPPYNRPPLSKKFLLDRPDPATLAIHGRVYLAEGWQRQAEEAVELGFTDLSIGYNRMANPGQPHTAHLEAAMAVKTEVDGIVGR